MIFGPVFSRRFGVSLGVDLSPSKKQCNFDCLYCELSGAKTVATQEQVAPLESILDTVGRALSLHTNLDVITITANGEPTLYPYLKEVVDFINEKKGSAKSLILSNGANICDKDIQSVLKRLDIVKLSLDSVLEKSFKKLDRPFESIDIKRLVGCMADFRESYGHTLVLESLFVDGVNDSDKDIDALKLAFEKIKPDRIDIGTIARPPAYGVKKVSDEKLLQIQKRLLPLKAFLASAKYSYKPSFYESKDIESTLKKRPLVQEEVDSLFDSKSKLNLEMLIKEKKVEKKEFQGMVFYLSTLK